MSQERKEVGVGLAVLAALGMLFASTMRIGACDLATPQATRIYATFDNAAGVERRTDILIAGVKVGEVDGVTLDGGRARLILRIDEPVRLPANSIVAIRSRGLLGERIVEITQGDSRRLVSEGDTLTRSVEAPSIDDLLDDLAVVSRDIREVTGAVRLVLGGERGEETIAAIVDDVRAVADGLREFLDESGPTLAKTLSNFDEVSENLIDFSGDIARITEDNEQTVGDMLESFADASQEMVGALENIKSVSEKIEKGEGTLGKLVADDEIYTKVDGSLAELQQTLTEVRRAAEDAQEQLPVTVLGSLVGSLF
jgi:phospholipid/cholesterol/gamma-HCH transport system substrate-binding protein